MKGPRQEAGGADLDNARIHLEQCGASVVLCRDADLIEKYQRGIFPLLELLEDGADHTGYSAADKIVGRAAAFLFVRLGVPRRLRCGHEQRSGFCFVGTRDSSRVQYVDGGDPKPCGNRVLPDGACGARDRRSG